MAKIYQPTYWKDGERCVYRHWYARIPKDGGGYDKVRLSTSREASELMVKEIVEARAQSKIESFGLTVVQGRELLTTHIRDFRKMLELKGTSERYATWTVRTLEKCFSEIEAIRPLDLTTKKIETYLESPEIIASGSVFGAKKALRAFLVWMVSTKRMASSPIQNKTNRKVKSSLIYFLRAGKFVKIGTTIDVNKRIVELQTACPLDMELLGFFCGNRDKEFELHERFSSCRVRPNGEWFHLSQDILDYIAEQQCEVKCNEPIVQEVAAATTGGRPTVAVEGSGEVSSSKRSHVDADGKKREDSPYS